MAAKGKTDSKDAAEGSAPEGDAKPARDMKKLALFIGAPVLLVVLLGAGAAFFLLGGEPAKEKAGGHGEHGEHASAEAHGEGGEKSASEGPGVFVSLPEMIVNIDAGQGKPAYLKLSVSVEVVDAEAAKKLEELAPKVIDQFQVFIRQLRLEDLNGSAGSYRLKEELLRRLNVAVAPIRVRDVLFKEMLVQ